MKIDEKVRKQLIARPQEKPTSMLKLPNNRMHESHFYLINFHPAGEPETFISCVIEGLQ
jgi:hypothetical protein